MIICINQIITPVNDNHYEIIVIYLYSRYLLKYFLLFPYLLFYLPDELFNNLISNPAVISSSILLLHAS